MSGAAVKDRRPAVSSENPLKEVLALLQEVQPRMVAGSPGGVTIWLDPSQLKGMSTDAERSFATRLEHICRELQRMALAYGERIMVEHDVLPGAVNDGTWCRIRIRGERGTPLSEPAKAFFAGLNDRWNTNSAVAGPRS